MKVGLEAGDLGKIRDRNVDALRAAHQQAVSERPGQHEPSDAKRDDKREEVARRKLGDRCGEKQDVERKREKDEGHNLPDGPFPNNQNDSGEGKRGQQHGC